MKVSRRGRRRRTAKALIDGTRRLATSLIEIDQGGWDNIYPDAASDEGAVTRRRAIFALNQIYKFLSLKGVSSTILFELTENLKAVEYHGDVPAIFVPARKVGRKSASREVQYLKGSLAGMAYLQMQYGLSREQAAGWLARNVPPELARQISRKPISPSTVKEWMDEYGGTLRVRRRIIQDGGLTEGPFFREEIRSLIYQEIQSKRMKGSNGEIGCLRMLGLGHLCLAAGAPLLYREIFAVLKEPFRREIPTPRKP